MMMLYPLNSPDLCLETVGGKALNLSHLVRANFKVPGGFVLSTAAYKSFVDHNDLNQTIHVGLNNVPAEQPAFLEQVSRSIRSAFSAGSMPAEVQRSIEAAYQRLGDKPLAVRSSATAEDLPELSFAGQQDSYLNVLGAEALTNAVVGCWSSLWTARAIGYRTRNQISHQDAAVAVVIQEMVPSDVSGVLFTANPLSGLRSESVIDSTFGLGEALVSGQVEPDHFVINHQNGEVIERFIGAKQVSTRTLSEGGVEIRGENQTDRTSLNQTQIDTLVSVGQQIQSLFGTPQDVEWAMHDDNLYILQSRPVTSLYPLPELSYDPLIVWISFGSVQGILGPMTPLGRDGIRHVFAGAAKLFNVDVEPGEISLLVTAGERLWIRISDFIRHPVGNRLFDNLMGYVEPSATSILDSLRHEQAFGAGTGRLKFNTLRRVLSFFGPLLIQIIGNYIKPEEARHRFDAAIEQYVNAIEVPENSDRYEMLGQTIDLMREKIQGVFRFVVPQFLPIMGPGMGSLTLLTKLAGEREELALGITRGLPNNVTTQMDLTLWAVAVRIKENVSALRQFQALPASELASRFLAGDLPDSIAKPIGGFLIEYGVRGVGEIDIGRKRWREDPTPVFQTLQSYLRISRGSAPDVIFRRGEQSAQQAVEELASSVRDQRFGWIKAKLVRAAAFRARIFLGARETPKFMAIRTMGIVREALLRCGWMFVEDGIIEKAEDLAFLHMDELQALSTREQRDWKVLIEQRRRSYDQEYRRRTVPRVLASDGRAFYEGLGAKSDTGPILSGSPVSPGIVEGTVQIVLDPHEADLEPGDILVCPGTDPAWTPLFLAAGGLVTEVGGMMTHGSVVAREYGIPAVVGVHEATTRLQNGQRVRLDGSAGIITLLDETVEES
jgi:pyruvate,water dikinase